VLLEAMHYPHAVQKLDFIHSTIDAIDMDEKKAPKALFYAK
jgi:hypothetical protein